MKDILKYIGLLVLIVFSFYYTDRISNAIVYQSDLMNEIIDSKTTYETSSIDAVISAGFIIPGINGTKINELDSYYNMKKDDIFSADNLVYDEVSPSKSIENNKNLIINKGNSLKKAVAIVIKNNEDVLAYAEKYNLTRLITFENYDKEAKYEQINIDEEKENYTQLETLLDKYHQNTNICYTITNKNECDEGKYIVTKTYEINNQSIINKEVISGDIIFIHDSLSSENFKLLLKEIKYRDLKIVFLSDLISENRM